MSINSVSQPHIDTTPGIEIGLYSLGDHIANPINGHQLSAKERIDQIIEIAQLAESAGFDVFQLGESHQEDYISQAHFIILSAIAQVTQRIKLGSAATVLSTSDPVRVFEDASTIDLLSQGRMELVAGRAARTGSFDLLGYDLDNYDELFEEKLDLLLQLNREAIVNWEGNFRKPLVNQPILPRPENETASLPIWRAVAGTVESAKLAGKSGIAMFISHLTGTTDYYKTLIEAYLAQAKADNNNGANMPIATAGLLYVREDGNEALRNFYPYANASMTLANGQMLTKQEFNQAKDVRSVINVGDPQLVVEKLLYQHEVLGMQRYVGQIDLGGQSTDEIKRTIDLLATKVIPEVKKHTRK